MKSSKPIPEPVRRAQRQYFKSRENRFLAESKRDKADVDKYLMDNR